MNRKRFLLLINLLSIWLVSLAITGFTFASSLSHEQAAGSFYQRYLGESWSMQVPAPYRLDCFRRNWNLSKLDASKQDAANHFLGLS